MVKTLKKSCCVVKSNGTIQFQFNSIIKNELQVNEEGNSWVICELKHGPFKTSWVTPVPSNSSIPSTQAETLAEGWVILQRMGGQLVHAESQIADLEVLSNCLPFIHMCFDQSIIFVRKANVSVLSFQSPCECRWECTVWNSILVSVIACLCCAA